MKVTLPDMSRKMILAPLAAGVCIGSSNLLKKSKKPSDIVSDDSMSKTASESIRNQFIAANGIHRINSAKLNPNGKIYVLSGSSGVGKDTVLRAFLNKHPEYSLYVSYTTRPIRPNETNGVDYHFISEDEFEQGIKNDEFLEWGEFSGNKYGTKKESVEASLQKNDKIIFKLDTVGALKVKHLIPQSTLIFIAPPSLEVLESRLRGRNTESEDAIQKRMREIKTEMENSKQFDYTIVNDRVENTVKSLEKILGLEK